MDLNKIVKYSIGITILIIVIILLFIEIVYRPFYPF